MIIDHTETRSKLVWQTHSKTERPFVRLDLSVSFMCEFIRVFCDLQTERYKALSHANFTHFIISFFYARSDYASYR